MDLKTGIFSLALGTLLLGTTARADDNQVQAWQGGDDTQVQAQGLRGGSNQPYYWDRDDNQNYGGSIQVHVHTSACHHGPQPTAPRNQQGRYELRYTQQWVPGRYEQVWVPEQCQYKHRRGAYKCRPGYYDQRWVEGHYENAEQWVWVPYQRWQRNTGPEWGTPAAYWRQ